MVMGAVGWGGGSLHGEDEPHEEVCYILSLERGRADSACALLSPCHP